MQANTPKGGRRTGRVRAARSRASTDPGHVGTCINRGELARKSAHSAESGRLHDSPNAVARDELRVQWQRWAVVVDPLAASIL
jgi:hypothetical protein